MDKSLSGQSHLAWRKHWISDVRDALTITEDALYTEGAIM